MTKSLSISAGDLFDRYEEAIRRNPESALRMVLWMTIYDDQPASWAREFLEDFGVFSKPSEVAAKRCDAGEVLPTEMQKEAKKIENSQLQRIHRKRKSLEASVGLPPRGQRGATPEYKKALSEWQRINRRPTREEMIAGWVPKPLPESFAPQVGKRAAEEKAKEDAVCQEPPGKLPAKARMVDVDQEKNPTGMEGHQDGQPDRGKAPDCDTERTKRSKGAVSPETLKEPFEPTLERQKKIKVLERMKTKLIPP